eukprot:3788249-Karenia_brevis.AAC.1
MNVSEPVTGEIQTNNRAELQAVVKVIQLESRPVELRTDSAYVYNGIMQHMSHWRQAGWRRKGSFISNADLWQELDVFLSGRPATSVRVTKVKGHASCEDVSEGL